MIPEETIMRHLDMLLSQSEPGATLHHLHTLSAPVGALGVPDPERLRCSVYAIDTGGGDDDNPEQFAGKAVMMAGLDAYKRGEQVVFAAVSMESLVVETADQRDGELARRLASQGRLQEHPGAAEATVVYGACRDGRRWTGRRYLTGPRAGQSEDARVLVGRPDPGEETPLRVAPLILKLVGL